MRFNEIMYLAVDSVQVINTVSYYPITRTK